MLVAFSCLLISSWLAAHRSQNSWVGRETILAKPMAGSPEPRAQTVSTQVLMVLHRWRLHILPGQPVPVSEHPHSENHLCSAEISCVPLCSTHLWAVSGHSWGDPGCPFIPSQQMLSTLMRIPCLKESKAQSWTTRKSYLKRKAWCCQGYGFDMWWKCKVDIAEEEPSC